MEAKEYQEIINTADCNAEVNFIEADGQLKIMGWAKTLIDIAYKAGVEEVVKWVEEHIKMNSYVYIAAPEWQAFKESVKEGK